ncbi:MAG: hypothetical protein OEM38_06710 [Gammaproteobacteria bacterium]|nr:hypothetical protein [Gammaproteobacteria bacterium]
MLGINADDLSVLIWGVFFGIVGYGYYSYGRKQKATVPLFTGISLFIFPYFISNVYILVTVGVVLMVIPYFVKI